MATDRCPWCGAEATHRFGRAEYRCGSYPEEQSPICARVTKLEAALRRIADENPPLETVDDWESKYASDNTGDVFDAGVTFGGVSCGNIAREALKP